MKRYTLIVVCALLSFTAFAQNNPLKGRIFDAYSHTALEGASIIVSETAGTITNNKGEFELDCYGTTSITIKYIGYETYTGIVKDCRQLLQIGLIPSDNNLNEVEVSASSPTNNANLKQPQSIGLLSRRELTRNEGVFLENTINLVSGVRMEKRTMSGGQRVVIRGYGYPAGSGNPVNFNGAGIKAYLNGIPVTDAEGITSYDDIDYSTLGKVEVIKGPASSLYGTGIGGVLKMYTLKPAPQATRIVQDAMAGSYGLWRSNTRMENASDKASVMVNYGHQNYDSYRVHSASKKDFATFIGDFRSSDKQSLSVYTSYNNSYDQLAGQMDSASFFNKENKGEAKYLANNGHIGYESFRTGVSHNYTFSKYISNVTSAYFSNYKQSQSSAAGLSSNMASNFGGRTEFNLNFTGEVLSLAGTVGGEYQKTNSFKKTNAMADGVLGGITTDLEVAGQQYSLFTEWNLQLPRNFTLIGGASSNIIEYGITDKLTNSANKTHKDQSGYKTFKPFVTPRVALQKVFGENITAYVSVSQGYSPPTSGNVVVPATGEVLTDLKPEKGTQYEVGSKGSLLDKKLSYQVALFDLNVSDKLTTQAITDPTSGTVLYSYSVNAGSQKNRGAELAVNYSVVDDNTKFVMLVRPFANYTYSDFTYDNFKSDNNNNERTVDYSGNSVMGVPEHNFNAGIDISTRPGIYLLATYQYVSDMPITFDNAHTAPGYSLLNAKLGWRKSIGNHVQFDVYAGGNNLTESLYYNMVFLSAYSASAKNPNIYLPAAYKATFYGGFTFSYKL
ncbi:TonB-dependent receptor [Pontibacter ruber]|uniref:TonB-dependent receptor n=1 Tax=Pontibacter ruber TaxID=1343895 RepID=A0ABW5CS62_9BACT|nr:TonB-dependent receptor [Pontibacter ruber]